MPWVLVGDWPRRCLAGASRRTPSRRLCLYATARWPHACPPALVLGWPLRAPASPLTVSSVVRWAYDINTPRQQKPPHAPCSVQPPLQPDAQRPTRCSSNSSPPPGSGDAGPPSRPARTVDGIQLHLAVGIIQQLIVLRRRDCGGTQSHEQADDHQRGEQHPLTADRASPQPGRVATPHFFRRPKQIA
jgi:hypothetical protein